MPPKKGAKGKAGGKKGGGKKGGGGKGPTIIDGVPASEMSRDQLEGHVRRLQVLLLLLLLLLLLFLLTLCTCRRSCSGRETRGTSTSWKETGLTRSGR